MTQPIFTLRGLYGIVDQADGTPAGRRALCAALLAGGVRAVQLRWKHASSRELASAARSLVDQCSAAGVPFFVNDRIDIALAVGATGVHLGQDDLALADARHVARHRPDFVIGISTHNAEQVTAAVAEGADYLGYGPVFATASKENPDPVQGIGGLRDAVALAGSVPVVAIGGITSSAARDCVAAGAAAVCAIGAVNRAANVTEAARAFAVAFAS